MTRILSWLFALARMASTGELSSCDPVWAHDPDRYYPPAAVMTDVGWYDVPAVACGPDGFGYDFVCTPSGCQ